MVKGLDAFKRHFADYSDCYILIGGIVATRRHDTDSWLQHCAWKRGLERDSLLKFDFTRLWREKADWEL